MASSSPLARLPRWMSHWLGYRDPATPHVPLPDYVVWFWSVVGAFCGLSAIQAIFRQSQHFIQRNVPSILASYGASAVLCYAAIESPLAQPRPLIGGHLIGAVTGVCISKLFAFLPSPQRVEDLRWLAASLSASIAIVLMQISGTTHPPAGATALLAAVSPEVSALGWYYLPVVLLSSSIVLVSALLVNNIRRRYPMFWWSPTVPPAASKDVEAGIDSASIMNR
ncbi:HPP family-domain-containing protein [Mycena rebaudengoi]|nr:HPP family-domain-containing protein [Mycena rebaudengoi]